MIPSSEFLPQTNDFLNTLMSSDLEPTLTNTFIDLFRFTRTIEYALSRPGVLLHPRSFDEDIILIQHDLLSIPETDMNAMSKACRVGALIYMITITRQMPFPPASARTIVQKLKNSLIRISEEPSAAPFLLWLLFMGGIAARGTTERPWFRDNLVRITVQLGELSTLEVVKKVLKGILWVDMIHDVPCKQLWDAIEMARNAWNGQKP